MPRWVVELDEELRFPTRYLYEDGLLSEAFKCWESGNLENAKMIKMLDHKYIVSGVFETERFVFYLSMNACHSGSCVNCLRLLH